MILYIKIIKMSAFLQILRLRNFLIYSESISFQDAAVRDGVVKISTLISQKL